MNNQQQDLKNIFEKQKTLISEINELNTSIAVKKELAIKYQGIIEYLTSSGVTLPKEEDQTIAVKHEGEKD